MADRLASLLVADDLLFAMNGKYNITGVYTGDILIAVDPTMLPQLVFLFLIETDVTEPFHSLTLEIKMPGSEPVRMPPVQIPPGPHIEGRTRQFLRWPQLVQNVRLSPGKIEAKVIHESGEIPVAGPWIVLAAPPPPT